MAAVPNISVFLIFLMLPANLIKGEPSEMEPEDGEEGFINKGEGLKLKILYKPEKCDMESKYGDHITWDYYGTLMDGTLFDQGEFWATLGSGTVIEGVDRAMLDMCVGEKRHMIIPPELAYGERGSGGDIPPHATIQFDVELKKINRPRTPPIHDDL